MDVPAQCPVCGAWSMTQDSQASALLAVCDVLVLKALEKLGHYIVRADRARFSQLGARPFHEAHTMVWRGVTAARPVDDELVDKALRGAWDVVPAMLDSYGCCDVTAGQVVTMLDGYVHDLAITHKRHSLEDLRYRFATRLGLPVYVHA